jgi:ribosomal protein S18 acetylase RimI-like enzyme
LEVDGTLSGVLVLQPQPDHLYLDNIALTPQVQGKGYGKQLLLFTEAFARERGLTEIRLVTNEAMVENIALYTRRGFVETERKDEYGYRRVHMRKTL